MGPAAMKLCSTWCKQGPASFPATLTWPCTHTHTSFFRPAASRLVARVRHVPRPFGMQYCIRVGLLAQKSTGGLQSCCMLVKDTQPHGRLPPSLHMRAFDPLSPSALEVKMERE